MNWFKALTNKFNSKPKASPKKKEEIQDFEDAEPLTLSIPEPKKIKRERNRFEYLSDDQKLEMYSRIGCLQSNKEIMGWLDEVGVSMSYGTIKKIRESEEAQPFIQKARKEFESKVSEIPVANKVKRIMELDKAFGRMREIEEKTDSDQLKIKSIESEVKILASVQGELEGKTTVEQNNFYYTQFNAMNKMDFEKMKLDCMTKIENYQKKVLEVKPIEEKGE